MFEGLTNFVFSFSSWLWSVPMLILLLFAHFYFTACTTVIQRKTFLGIRLSCTKDEHQQGDISPFAALSTLLASTIGTGNIIGVGTALALGGAGALFWCWVTGILGIATKYAECFVAIKYRTTTASGTVAGGAMYALEHALGKKKLAKAFALFTALAAFGIGCGVQSNAIATVMNQQWNIAPASVGVLVLAFTALVIFGGVTTISAVCERMVPIIGTLFVAANFFLLWQNRTFIFPALQLILTSAFQPPAIIGGLAGRGILAAMRAGVSRGLFSNESGMGSAPIIASAANTGSPVRMALISSTATFWDTVVLFALTGIAVIASLLRTPALTSELSNGGGTLTVTVFHQIPLIGGSLVAFSIVMFAFSTILGWSYCGERAAEYLLGKVICIPYRVMFCGIAFIACLIDLDFVWAISDILNACMAVPNLTALFLLSDEIKCDTKAYFTKTEKRLATYHAPICESEAAL